MTDMELVIKIPEKIYKHIMSMQFYIPGSRSGTVLLEEILKAIRTGTPLPKGHGRLIDADAVLEEPIGNTYKDIDIAETIIEADEKTIPTANEIEREKIDKAIEEIKDNKCEIACLFDDDWDKGIEAILEILNKYKGRKRGMIFDRR